MVSAASHTVAADLSAASIPVGFSLTADQFLSFQRAAERHIGLSLTRACPLKCAHCIVATVAPSAFPTVSIEAAQVDQYAAELADLAVLGVDAVSFTGGEPLLAQDALRVLSEAAARAGMRVTVVTAAHWAHSPKAAARVVEKFGSVSDWHLSTDVFHAEFLPPHHVVDAAYAVLDSGRTAVIRMAVATPPTGQDVALYESVVAALPERVPVAVQPVTRAGRASELDVGDPPSPTAAAPCVSTGMVVRDDGTVSPCCGPLTDQRDGHPFRWAPASHVGLVDAYVAWRTDPLLQLVRSVGFGPLLPWVAEEDPDHPVLRAGPAHPCDTCVALWCRPGTEEIVRRRLSVPDVLAKVRDVHHAVFVGDDTADVELEREGSR